MPALTDPAAVSAHVRAAPGPGDFDETTPPPRARLARCLRFAPGEDVPAHFAAWVRCYRVPPGSVLVEFVGTLGRVASGYVDAKGKPVPWAALEPLVTVSSIVVAGNGLTLGQRRWVVMARREGT